MAKKPTNDAPAEGGAPEAAALTAEERVTLAGGALSPEQAANLVAAEAAAAGQDAPEPSAAETAFNERVNARLAEAQGALTRPQAEECQRQQDATDQALAVLRKQRTAAAQKKAEAGKNAADEAAKTAGN